MEGLLATVLLAGVMIGALLLLGRSWPRSSRLGGYRARLRGGRDAASDPAPGEGAIREDNDFRWRWQDAQATPDDEARAAVVPPDAEPDGAHDPQRSEP